MFSYVSSSSDQEVSSVPLTLHLQPSSTVLFCSVCCSSHQREAERKGSTQGDSTGVKARRSIDARELSRDGTLEDNMNRIPEQGERQGCKWTEEGRREKGNKRTETSEENS